MPRGRPGWIEVRGPRSRRPRSRLLDTGALFAIVLVGAASLMLMRANEPMPCDGGVPLKIMAAPAIAPVVDAITKRDIDTSCADVRVVAQGGVDAARTIAAGGPDLPALWIPDSALWPERANQLAAASGGEAPQLRPGPSLVTSPLVVVTDRTEGDRLGWPSVPVGWRDLGSGSLSGVPTTIGDPLATTEGLATLTAVRTTLSAGGTGGGEQELVGAMLQVGRDAAPSIRSAYDRLDAAGRPMAFTATEQSVVAHNRDATGTPAVAIYPREGTVALEYPLVRVLAPDESPAAAELAGRLEQVLRAPAATRTLLEAGFRGPDGTLDDEVGGATGVVSAKPALLPAPSAGQATEVLRTWSAVTLDSRMLVVIDVSGSMNAGAGNGQSRIALARDASLAALGLFPDRTSIGLWAFSTADPSDGPTEDWTELVPIGPLSEPLPAGTRREAVAAAARSLRARADGRTALNDTVLAAFRNVLGSYESGKVNSVVLLTDGRNEDPDSIDTATLIRTLREESDAARPVPVIAIGLGPEVDFQALQQIAAATEGKAYLAADPADMRGVLLDALIQRQCRPNC